MLVRAIVAVAALAPLRGRCGSIPDGAPLGHWSVGPTPIAAPATAVAIPLGASIQAVIDQHPPGTVYLLRAGTRRLQQIVPKDGDTIAGEPGATLNGARVLSAFTAQGGRFVATGERPDPGMRRHGVCLPDFPRCDLPQDLYFDGKPLRAVAKLSDVRPGAWYYALDTGGVYIADDPSGHALELSRAPFAIGGRASRVTVRNLVIEHYAASDQAGAVNHRGGGTGWLVSHNEVRWNHGYGVALDSGDRAVANNIHHNGELGIGGGSSHDQVVQGNEIAFNGWNGTDCEWECGGAKWGTVDRLVVAGNWVHDNQGDGLWTDESSSAVTVESNVVSDNRLAGISHEISYGAVIRGNVLCGNGRAAIHWGWSAQIQIQNSSDTAVYANRLFLDPARGGNGITIIDQDRGPEHRTHDVRVDANTIVTASGDGVAAGWFADTAAPAPRQRDPWFSRNTYIRAAPEGPGDGPGGRFWARGKVVDFAAWRALGEDLAGASFASTAAVRRPAACGDGASP